MPELKGTKTKENLKVAFAGDSQAALVKASGTVLRVVADPPAHRAQAVLSEETRRELAADLD